MIATISKYAAYGLGAAALLIGSFVTISALTGTPANEMKAVGGLFPESVTPEETTARNADGETPEEEREADIRSPRQVFENSTTPLGAFALQDPFSAEELRDLERQLQVKIDELARRHHELEQREREVEADRQHYLDQFAQFEQLRTALLEQRDENDANAEEIDRASNALDEKQAEIDRGLAKFFEETKAKDAASMLTKTYAPDKAARILVQLDEDRQREIMSAIYQILPGEGQQYMKAVEKRMQRR